MNERAGGSRQELDQGRTRCERLVNRAPIGVFELLEGRFSYVNRFLLNLSGYSAADLLGHSPTEFVVPSDREKLATNMRAKMQGESSQGVNAYTFFKKGGGTFEARVESELVPTAEGGLIAGTLRDVTVEMRLARLHSTVLALTEVILAERDIDRILRLALEAITGHSGFQRAAVSLYDLSCPDPLDGRVYKRLAAGLSPEEEERLHAGEGLSPEERRMAFSDRFRLGAAYYIPHDQVPWSEDLGVSGRVTLEGWHKDDYLFIPLRGETGIIGHISVDDPIDQSAPTVESIEPVAYLANFAALAVERVHKLKQLERQKERLHGLSQFGRELSQASEIEILCELAAKRLRDDMDYDFSEVWLVEGANLVLQGIACQDVFAQAALPEKNTRVPLLQTGAIRWVVEHQELLLIPDVRRELRYQRARDAVLSEIAVPILGRKGTLGVINAESGRVGAFGAQDVEILTSLASQLSVAISNVRRRESLTRIYLLGQQLAEATSQDQLISSTLSFLGDHYGVEHGAVLLCEGTELVIRGVRSPREGQTVTEGTRIPFTEGIVGRVAATRRYALVNDVAADPAYVAGFEGIRSELAVPMALAGKLLGVLNVESPRPGFFDEEDQQLMEAVANEMAIALSNLNSQDGLRRQAVLDPLTGLYNRQYFNAVIGAELKRADRYDHPVSLMMIDVDGFRAVNNRLGHLKGDEVLRAVAGFLGENVRASDRVIRYGGDEFLVIMPETDGECLRVAKRLKKRIARIPEKLHLGGVTIGLSIGIYTRTPHDPRSLEEILEDVDRKMYADKRASHDDRADEYLY
jgi:diguanylate cyclase (GGDEF)-like protein/PAS domain S-box-containing protein